MKSFLGKWAEKRVQETQDGGTADIYRFKDGLGEIGFISSVTKPFCGTCSRLRLSAEGKLYTCLFAAEGLNLGEHLRNGASDELLGGMIRNVWTKRDSRYSEIRSELRQNSHLLPKVEMYQVGG